MKENILAIVLALSMTTCFANCTEKAPAHSPQGDSVSSDAENTLSKDSTKTMVYHVYSISEDGNTNIRKEPSTKSKVIGKLYTNGKGVKLIDASGTWWKVDMDGTVGFVNSKYVTRRHPQANEGTANNKPIALKPRPVEKIKVDSDDGQSKEDSSTKKSSDSNKSSGNSESAKSSSSSSNSSSAQKATNGKSKTVYYVVISSWLDFEKAKNGYGKIPDALEGPIYKVNSNGKIIYRMCPSCFSTKEAAQAELKKISKNHPKNDFWIWESNGLANYVYGSVDAKGNKMKALSPR